MKPLVTLNLHFAKKILKALILIHASQGFCQESDSSLEAEKPTDNVITITGKRKSKTSSRSTGQSSVINPKDGSEFSSDIHLKREVAIIVPETGRVSPSGFAVPKIRGQDVKMSDVYIEDIQLQDPYSGLPLMEDLDLRAFGTFEIHQGLSPVSVLGLNPTGAIRYRFRPETVDENFVGLQFGKPYGTSVWGLHQSTLKVDEDESSRHFFKLYLRKHQTNGKYSFYSDEGTPYNTDDDKIKTRDNNDQTSAQAIPYYRYKGENWGAQMFAWIFQSDKGIPSLSTSQNSLSREASRGMIYNLGVTRNLRILPDSKNLVVGVDVVKNDLKLDTSDPNKSFLLAADSSRFLSRSQKLRFKINSLQSRVKTNSSFEQDTASIETFQGERQENKLLRHSQIFNTGAETSFLDYINLELKFSTRNQRDQRQNDQAFKEDVKDTRHQSMNSKGAALSVGDDKVSGYMQAVQSSRLPSLLEEYGNGSVIRSNASLESEKQLHREAGFVVKSFGEILENRFVYFKDSVDHKIVFSQVTASSSMAQNIHLVKIDGYEFQSDADFDPFKIRLAYSRLLPRSIFGTDSKIVPGIAEHVFITNEEYSYENWVFRWMSRYRSQIYRDLGNSVVLPGAWMHDCSFDLKQKLDKVELELGLSVRNVMNQMDVAISAPDSPQNTGRTSYSDYSGMPLPGRQWVLSAAVSF